MRELVERIDTTHWSQRLLRTLDWKVFERLCGEVLMHLGYAVAQAQRKQMDGVDLVIRRPDADSAGDGPGIAVHCESSHYPLSVRQVGEFYSTAKAAGFRKGLFITTGVFNRRASELFGQKADFQLITGRKFLEGIAELGDEVSERLLAIATTGDDFDVPTCPSCEVKMEESLVHSLELRWGRKAWVCPNRENMGCLRSFGGA